MKAYRSLIVFVCLSFLLACGSGSLGPGIGGPGGGGGGGGQPPTLVSIAVTPADATVLLGAVQQFTATGTFSDNTTQDITGSVTWSSSDATVVSIDASGVATATALGSVTITATSGTITGSTTLNVAAAVLSSIAVKPATRKIAPLTSQQFQAIGTFTDGSTQNLNGQVTWTSSNTAVATITAGGRAKGLTQGSTTLTATLGAISGTGTLNVSNATIVSVTVTPAGRTIAQGTKLPFVANGLFSDNTRQVITRDSIWASDNLAVATVSTGGTATGVGPGTANISATFSGVSGFAALNVSSATLTSISVTPGSAVLAPTTFVNCVATGTYSDGTTQVITTVVSWTSSAPNVATVNGAGRVTALSAGNATITAQLGALSANCNILVDGTRLTSIRVTPQTASIVQQTNLSYVATGTFADGNTQNLTGSVMWTSSVPSVATISNAPGTIGQATGLAPGTTTIKALFGGQIGRATLTVTIAGPISLRVSSAATNLEAGGLTQISAVAEFSDGTTRDVTSSVTWTSSDETVAVITPAGVVTSTGAGITTVTATMVTATTAATTSATMNDLSETAVLRVY